MCNNVCKMSVYVSKTAYIYIYADNEYHNIQILKFLEMYAIYNNINDKPLSVVSLINSAGPV